MEILSEGIEWGTIVYSLIAFTVLMYIVGKFALKPLMGLMEKRQNQVNDDLDNAEKSRVEAEKYLEQQRDELKAARVQAQETLEQASKMSEQQSREVLDQAKQEAERIKEAAVQDIEREKEQALESVRDQVASLSVAIATKVIEKELDEKEQERLIENYLKEVEAK